MSAWVRRTAPTRSLVPRSRLPSPRRSTRTTWRRLTPITSSRMAGARVARRSTSPRQMRMPAWRTTMRMTMRTSKTLTTLCSSRGLYRSHTPRLPIQSSVENGPLVLDAGAANMREHIMIGDDICSSKA